MCSSFSTLLLVFLCLNAAWQVDAGLYVINPLKGSVCQANQPCTITWLDDGRFPLLTSIGVSTVGLYTANQQLVQSIEPVNVATRRSITFKPNPAAGPNSDHYYIALASTTLNVNGTTYMSYSPYFTLTGMSGSFASPLPAATSSLPIAPSLTATQSSSPTSTITVSSLYSTTTTAISSSSSSFSNSRFITSVLTSSTSATSSTSTSQSGAVGLMKCHSALLSSILTVLVVVASSFSILFS